MIEFKNVSKVYENGTEALSDISLKIEQGEFVFVVGASGAGKSTFLKLVMREENVTSGDILNAFFPISCYPLWFAGFYMVLLLATPILNMILDKFDRKQLKKGLIIFGFLSVFFVTFTNRPGFFSHDIWAMMYVYLLTGYIQPSLFPSS